MKLITKTDISSLRYDESQLSILSTTQFQNIFEEISNRKPSDMNPKTYLEYQGIGRISEGTYSFPVTLYALRTEGCPSNLLIVKG